MKPLTTTAILTHLHQYDVDGIFHPVTEIYPEDLDLNQLKQLRSVLQSLIDNNQIKVNHPYLTIGDRSGGQTFTPKNSDLKIKLTQTGYDYIDSKMNQNKNSGINIGGHNYGQIINNSTGVTMNINMDKKEFSEIRRLITDNDSISDIDKDDYIKRVEDAEHNPTKENLYLVLDIAAKVGTVGNFFLNLLRLGLSV